MKELFLILPSDEKNKLIFFSILSFFAMILETLGIALVFPLIIVFLKGNLNSYDFLYKFQSYFDNYDPLVFFLILLSLTFIIKNLFLIYCSWYNISFGNRVEIKVQKKLFNFYLNQNFLEYLAQNSAIKYRNMQTEISVFKKYLDAFLILIFESFILFGIIIFFLVSSFNATIILIAVISSFILIFYFFAKTVVYRWQKKSLYFGRLASKTLLEGLNNFKDIKIFGKSKMFSDIFSKSQNITLNIGRNVSIAILIPKIFLEIILIIAISITILFLKNTGVTKTEIIAILGTFVAASFRIFPSVTRIIYSFNKIKGGLPSIGAITEDLEKAKKSNLVDESIIKRENFLKKIKFENVSFSYNNKKKNSLNDISLEIPKGSIVGISGKSGSGKSTLLHLLLGLLQPNSGLVLMDNLDIKKNFDKLKHNFGYVSQQSILFDESILFNITLKQDSDPENNTRLKKVLETVNLTNFLNGISDGVKTIIGEKALKISGGQKQRITIARAIYNDPEVIIFDEATSELDDQNEKEIFNNIIKDYKNKTLIFISHNRKLFDYCNLLINVEDNKVKILEKN